MRKIRGNRAAWTQAATAPLGVCDMCTGAGRYKTTYKYKAPIIHHCLYCRGTGKVKVKFRRKDGVKDWREEEPLELVSGKGDTYVCKSGDNGFTVFDKESYEPY